MAIINFTLQPAKTIDIDTDKLTLRNVSDNQVDLIIASIEGFWRDIVLWQGADEYAAAGIWTNQTALDRAKELIESGNIRFA